MGNPYTSVTVSNYNASPPDDDGSAVSSNQLKWSNHKDKLGDPLKTAIEAINSNVSTAFSKILGADVDAKAGNYTVTTADQGKFISFSAQAIATLPAVASAGTGFAVMLVNLSSSVLTVDPDGSELINGDDKIWIGPNGSALLTCDGSAWTAAISQRFPQRELTKAADYTMVAADVNTLLEVTATATITLPIGADAGYGFTVAIWNNSTVNITVDTQASETINGETSKLIAPGGVALLFADSSGDWEGPISAEAGTFTGTLTGYSSNPSGTVNYILRGGRCTLFMDDSEIIGTSNATTMTMTGLPAAVQPASAIQALCVVRDNNNSNPFGKAQIAAGGAVITFHRMASDFFSASNFTASNSKGIVAGWQIDYPLG